ncbi:L,D-transpeptidase family protein [Streptomyces sp. 4N509B]|uniref:L,D-transpeptidase family protein n=1 Tax=Streptomyces sp. 4N509B TaxID=3457413 RepID=UPI003FD57E9F
MAVAGAVAVAVLVAGCTAEGTEPSGEQTGGTEQTEGPRGDDGEGAQPDGGAETEPVDEVLFQRGDTSDEVRELQARLAQLGFFAAQPTGFFGDVTFGSVSEFQRAEGLEVSGEVSTSTWDALTGQTETPTQEEMFPPQPVLDYGESSDQVRELQARLAQLDHFTQNPTGYYGEVTAAAVSAFQQAAGLEDTGTVYEDTWSALTSQTETPTQDEMFPPLDVPEAEPAQVLDERCLTGRVLCISKTSNSLSWVIDGEVQATMDVRFGAADTPTREGEFEVYWKSRDHHSTLYDTPMPYAMFFDGGQAVHYSADFAANGYNGASHGCVNVRDEGAVAALFDEVNEGDKVIVYW